ncbi:MAG: phenylalanine--tRNA ligase subunit beta [Chloroflexi bacterium]|nr:phenylalanine--tRNA ligase subunit beta [Chloroflexota bacterium]
MKVPVSWLREYVDIEISLEDLAHRLTMAGTEVDSIERTGWIDGVVVGYVKAVRQHPDADRLTLVTVDHGDGEAEVVCGAPNVAQGQKIAYASIGAVLFDAYADEPGKTRKLKRSKIRGVVSEGMVCSVRELGIGEEHEGILVLDENVTVGTPIGEVIGESVLDIELTPNRPDCLGIVGVARDVAAITGKSLREPDVSYEATGPDVHELASVEIADPDLCPRYTASVIEGVKIGPSPKWLQERLVAIGERPINSIVDITNFVMFELGQPLHAFDYDKVVDHKVIVRRAADGEKLVTLDEKERKLDADMLLIADPERGIGLAGVMGGVNTEISDSTTTVFLESATFHGVNNRRTARVLELSSQATLRFEKGLRSGLSEVGLRRATKLILEIAGGKAASGIIDVHPGNGKEQQSVRLDRAHIKKVLGIEFETTQVESTLGNLGFEMTSNADGWNVQIPYWRPDISISEDLVEELARIIGYDNIPATTLSGRTPKWQPQPKLDLRRRVTDALVQAGMRETIGYSATTATGEARVALPDDMPQAIKLRNPVSVEFAAMRRTLRESILETVARNSRTWRGPIAVFEAGSVFLDYGEGLPEERQMVAGAFAGPRDDLHWDAPGDSSDFYDAKGALEAVLEDLGVQAVFEPVDDPSFTPGRTAIVKVPAADHLAIGVVGEVDPEVFSRFNAEAESVAMFELDLAAVLKIVQGSDDSGNFEEFVRLPASHRDLSLVVDTGVTASQIVEIASRNKTVTSATVFDVFEGEGVPEGKKAVAVRLIYQLPNKTLTADQVGKIEQQTLKQLLNELGAELRAQV